MIQVFSCISGVIWIWYRWLPEACVTDCDLELLAVYLLKCNDFLLCISGPGHHWFTTAYLYSLYSKSCHISVKTRQLTVFDSEHLRAGVFLSYTTEVAQCSCSVLPTKYTCNSFVASKLALFFNSLALSLTVNLVMQRLLVGSELELLRFAILKHVFYRFLLHFCAS